MKTHQETIDLAVKGPPIEANQYWFAVDHDGNMIRRLRILGEYPEKETGECDGRYLFEDMPSPMFSSGNRISITPGYNLRRIFTLEGTA